MNLIKDKKTGVYKAQIRTPHGTKQITTRCTDKREAKKVAAESKLREIELQARAGQLTATGISLLLVGKKITIEKAIERWVEWASSYHSPLTVHGNKGMLTRWARECKIEKLSPAMVTGEDVSKWANGIGHKLSMRRKALSIIRSFFSYCSSNSWCVGNPVWVARVRMDGADHDQKEPNQKLVYTDHEIQMLLKSTGPDGDNEDIPMHVAIGLGRYLGLRLGDCYAIEWDCFQQPGKVIVWTDKRNRRVALDMPEELAPIVALIPVNGSNFCFPDAAENFKHPTRRGSYSKKFTRVTERLGMAGKTFHELRHTYATECDRLGTPMPHISRNMGHAHEATTRGYIQRFKE